MRRDFDGLRDKISFCGVGDFFTYVVDFCTPTHCLERPVTPSHLPHCVFAPLNPFILPRMASLCNTLEAIFAITRRDMPAFEASVAPGGSQVERLHTAILCLPWEHVQDAVEFLGGPCYELNDNSRCAAHLCLVRLLHDLQGRAPTAMHYYAVESTLAGAGEGLDAQDEDGNTPLMLAMSLFPGHYSGQIVRAIVHHGQMLGLDLNKSNNQGWGAVPGVIIPDIVDPDVFVRGI